MTRVMSGVILALVVALLCGCDDGKPKTVAVTGTVTYKDQPVSGAQVIFYSGTGRPAEATTDANGKFTLASFSLGDGAVIGKHKVTVVKMVSQNASDPYAPATNALPARYGLENTTPLEEEVKASGPNDFQFKLTDS